MRPQAPVLQPQRDLFTQALDGILHLLFKLLRYLGRRLIQSPLVGLAYLLFALPALFLIVQDGRQALAVAGTPRFSTVPQMWPLQEPLSSTALVGLFLVIVLVVTFDRWMAYRARRSTEEASKPEPLRIEDWVLGRAYRRVWEPDPGEFRLEPTGELYKLTEEHLRTHMIIVAPTGSGKTVSVLEPALQLFKRIGAAAIYLDAKGDSFDPKQFHLNFDLMYPEGSMKLLVWSGRAPRDMAERLAEALVTDTGTEPRYYIDNAKIALSALVGAHYRAYGRMPPLTLLLTYLRNAEAREDLAAELRRAGVPEKGSELEDLGQIKKLAGQKTDVLGSLDTALAPLCRGAIANLLVSDPTEGYSIEQLVSEPARVRFGISTNDHPLIAPIVGRLIMAQFTYAVLSPRCNKRILKAVVADEAKEFVTKAVADGMAMARENRGAYLLAFQNMSQIANATLRQDILSVAGNKLVMAGVDDYDAEKFSRLFGSRERRYVSHSQSSSQGSNSSRSRGSGREGGDLIGGIGSLRQQSSHIQSSSLHQSEGTSTQVRERSKFLPSEIRELPQYHVLIERRDSRGEMTPVTLVHMDYELTSGIRTAQALKLYDKVGHLEAASPHLPRISKEPQGSQVAVGVEPTALSSGSDHTDQAAAPSTKGAATATPSPCSPSPSDTPTPSPTVIPDLPDVSTGVQSTGEAHADAATSTPYPEWVDAAAQDISEVLGIGASQAQELAFEAFRNGRDQAYLAGNIEYVRSSSKVKRPAELFAFLVQANQYRTKQAAGKRTGAKAIDTLRAARKEETEANEQGRREDTEDRDDVNRVDASNGAA